MKKVPVATAVNGPKAYLGENGPKAHQQSSFSTIHSTFCHFIWSQLFDGVSPAFISKELEFLGSLLLLGHVCYNLCSLLPGDRGIKKTPHWRVADMFLSALFCSSNSRSSWFSLSNIIHPRVIRFVVVVAVILLLVADLPWVAWNDQVGAAISGSVESLLCLLMGTFLPWDLWWEIEKVLRFGNRKHWFLSG